MSRKHQSRLEPSSTCPQQREYFVEDREEDHANSKVEKIDLHGVEVIVESGDRLGKVLRNMRQIGLCLAVSAFAMGWTVFEVL